MSHRLTHLLPKAALFWGLLSLSVPTFAATILVPADQPTIQAAIVAAGTGDVVLVSPGTYAEEINFLGKAITVRSAAGAASTIINPATIRVAAPKVARHLERRVLADGRVELLDRVSSRLFIDAAGRSEDARLAGGNDGSVVLFTNSETRASVLEGFTITGGDANFDGGGVRIEQGASPTVRNNTITGNQACTGGAGISVSFSSPLIETNVISGNQQAGCSGGGGGGIELVGAAAAELRGNTIYDNAHTFGGAISLFAAGTPIIAGNAIYANTSSSGGGGFDIVNASNALIVQNVVRGNTGGTSKGDGIDWSVPSGQRGPILLNNSLARNGDLDLRVDGFDIAAEVVGNIIVASPGGTAVFCGNSNDPNPPIFGANNVSAPSGTVYGGICGNPTGSNGNISDDPLFVNITLGNLHLLEGSPSVDAGDDTHPDLPSTDFDGFERIVDGDGDTLAVVDQGAFERLADGPVFSDSFEAGDTSAWSLTQP